MDRRRFLELSTGAALSLSVARCQKNEAVDPMAPRGVPWGMPRADQMAAMVPQELVPKGVLDICLLGGICPWDTFYVVPEHGDPTQGGKLAGQQWWTFQQGGEYSVKNAFTACGGGNRSLYEPWGLDSAGKTINLGPFIYPLRDRPDLLKRMRLYVLRHKFEPHHAAIPLALTGYERGTQQLASHGAHHERFQREQAGNTRSVPYSYVIYQTSVSDATDHNTDAASAVGLHSAGDRPFSIRMTNEEALAEKLGRAYLGQGTKEHDALVAHYLENYKDALRAGSGGTMVRSPSVREFDAARRGLLDAPELQALLPWELLQSKEVTLCGRPGVHSDESESSLRLATHLLNHPEQPAKHVALMETGAVPDTTGLGFDTHVSHIERSSANVVHFFKRFVGHINEPGEKDPNKIDLDQTMVVLNTEFGRSPTPERTPANPDGTGLDHWPWGYVIAVFGGYVTEGTDGVVGSIDESGYATDYLTPTEHRAAMLLASGIWPFTAESYRVADVRDAQTEMDAAMILRERVLGLKG